MRVHYHSQVIPALCRIWNANELVRIKKSRWCETSPNLLRDERCTAEPPTVAVLYLQSYPRTNPPPHPTHPHTHTHTTVNVARRLPTARFCRLITAWRRRHLDMADPSAGGTPSHLGPLCSLQRALHSSARKTEPRPGERGRATETPPLHCDCTPRISMGLQLRAAEAGAPPLCGRGTTSQRG